MDITKDVLLLQQLVEAGDAITAQLGKPQQEWLLANIKNLKGFMYTEEGRAALCLFLEEFCDYTIKNKGVTIH